MTTIKIVTVQPVDVGDDELRRDALAEIDELRRTRLLARDEYIEARAFFTDVGEQKVTIADREGPRPAGSYGT